MKNYSFGNYICEQREKKGLSQSQLGEMLGVTNKAVSRWENGGAYPSTELMLPLAKALGVTIEDLYNAISYDKQPKSKLRIVLEYLVQHSKIVILICIALAAIPYAIFLIFSTVEYKSYLALETPLICVLVYIANYFAFVLCIKSPLISGKVVNLCVIVLFTFVFISYSSGIHYFIMNINSFSSGKCAGPIIFISIVQALKKRYK